MAEIYRQKLPPLEYSSGMSHMQPHHQATNMIPPVGTAMGAAFASNQAEREERLRQWAVDALASSKNESQQREYVANKLRFDMMWLLIEQWDRAAGYEAIRFLLRRTQTEIGAAKAVKNTGAKPVGGGQGPSDTQSMGASATHSQPDGKPRAAAPSSGSGQSIDDTQLGRARPTTSPTAQDTGHVSVGGGQGNRDTQQWPAPATPSRDDAQPQAVRRSEPAIQPLTPMMSAPAAPPMPEKPQFGGWLYRPSERPKGPTMKELADAQARRAAERVKSELRVSKLDTVMVNGKSIGKCVVGEVRMWIDERRLDVRDGLRDVRFAAMLVSGLPGNIRIGDYWKPDEADQHYAKAELEAIQNAKNVGCAA